MRLSQRPGVLGSGSRAAAPRMARGPPPLCAPRHGSTCLQTSVAPLCRRYPRHSITAAAASQNSSSRSPAAEARRRNELVDLAVLNAKLAGTTPPWEARARLELLRGRRRKWEAVCELVRASDAAATLEAIEDAAAQVESILSEEEQESTPVAALPARLATLRADVDAAAARLASTRARVAAASARLDALQSEAAALERARRADSAEHAHEAPLNTVVPTSTTTTAAPAASPQTDTPTGSRVSDAGSTSRRSPRRRHGLAAALAPEPALREFWYPVEFTSRLGPEDLIPIRLFDEAWVLFRDAQGAAACVRDECAHRACPLSAGGRVVGGEAECPYHGWRFSPNGTCTKMPSTRTCHGVRIDALPVAEHGGFVWIWPGEGQPSSVDVPSAGIAPPEGYQVHAELEMIVPVEHGLLVENLLDLAHAPFTHQGTFAKGWPVPESVKFHARRTLGGVWDPYPVDMAFQPPCMTVSRIGLVRPGRVAGAPSADACTRHIHQVHACLPAGPKSTRLLYRMSMDFMGWAKHVPFVTELWKSVAGQVLGEDLKLVVGQQARLEAGGDTWNLPVPYDQMGVRYRRWRNTLKAPSRADGEGRGDGDQLPRTR